MGFRFGLQGELRLPPPPRSQIQNAHCMIFEMKLAADACLARSRPAIEAAVLTKQVHALAWQRAAESADERSGMASDR
jgi:hypothetical protein